MYIQFILLYSVLHQTILTCLQSIFYSDNSFWSLTFISHKLNVVEIIDIYLFRIDHGLKLTIFFSLKLSTVSLRLTSKGVNSIPKSFFAFSVEIWYVGIYGSSTSHLITLLKFEKVQMLLEKQKLKLKYLNGKCGHTNKSMCR